MDCERLIQLREEKGMTKTAVASYIGISSAGYGYYESGQRTPPPDMLMKISELFNVSVDYLLGKTDYKGITQIDENNNAVIGNTVEYMTTKERIPILGTIKAGYNMYAEQNVLGYKDTDASKIKNKEVFWLKVKGNSMNAVGIFDGSLVLV